MPRKGYWSKLEGSFVKVEVRNAHVQLIRRNVELSLVGVARRRMMKCLLIRMSRAFEQAALDSMLSLIRRVTVASQFLCDIQPCPPTTSPNIPL